MLLCPYCNAPAVRTTGATIYPHRPDLWGRVFYHCAPCGAYVGTHRDGTPLGRLANAELRRAKQHAHSHFDRLWTPPGNVFRTRTQAYAWMARSMGLPSELAHIGMFDVDQCNRLVSIIQNRHVQPPHDLHQAGRPAQDRAYPGAAG